MNWTTHSVRMSYPASQTERSRVVTAAIPDSLSETTQVIYCADGQVVERLVQAMEIVQPVHKPVLIGVYSEERLRAEEYLYPREPAYLAHESFFVHTVRRWAAERFSVSMARENSTVFGFSNGGAFAITVALRNALSFSSVIAFSIPPFPSLPALADLMPKPVVYLSAGNQGPEKVIRKNVDKLAKQLQRSDIHVTLTHRQAGHEMGFWIREFVLAVNWLNADIAT